MLERAWRVLRSADAARELKAEMAADATLRPWTVVSTAAGESEPRFDMASLQDQRGLPLGFPSLLRSGPPAPPHCPICDYAPAPEEKTCSECGYDFSDTGNADKIRPGLL